MTADVRNSTLLQRVTGWFGGLPGKAADVLPVRVGGTEYRQSSSTPASVLGFDQALLWVVVALLAWGLVMVYSASIAMPDNPRFANYASTHFLTRHAMYLVIGFVVALLAFQVPMALWERAAPWLFVVALLLLIAVLIPGVGKVVNGARRWLSIGPIGFQPSEVAKFAVLIYAAGGVVLWQQALMMMVAATAGGYGGARVARKLPANVLRWGIVATGLVMAALFFWRQ